MKRMLTILTLVIMSYSSNSLSMQHGHNGKVEQEQQQAAAQVNQDYQALGKELNKSKPNEIVLEVLTAEIVESMSSLNREQRVATVTAHAATNKMNAEFKTKKQKQLHGLSQKGNKIVELLTLVTTGPEGASSGEVITEFIQQGATFHRQIIKIDCMAEPEFAEKFYALLQHPRIKPFAAQGLQLPV